MIANISGKLIARDEDTIVVDVNGVGYQVFACGSSFASTEFGKNVSLLIYTDVRENAIVLFGFSSIKEKQVFLMLKKVQGIGSRLALSIVSAVGAEGVLHAISQQDLPFFTRISGIGKKTAERIIVELREQVGTLVGSNPALSRLVVENTRTNAFKNDFDPAWASTGLDAVLALEKLGFGLDKAKQAVRLAIESQGQSNPTLINNSGELLKCALANL